MSYTIFFPGSKDAEPYKGLEDEEEVYAVVKKEVRQSVVDMGSDGYDLIWPEHIVQTYDDIEAWLETLDEEAQQQAVADAHEAGIDRVAVPTAVSVFESLWRLHKDDQEFTSDKLPDGTKIALKEED